MTFKNEFITAINAFHSMYYSNKPIDTSDLIESLSCTAIEKAWNNVVQSYSSCFPNNNTCAPFADSVMWLTGNARGCTLSLKSNDPAVTYSAQHEDDLTVLKMQSEENYTEAKIRGSDNLQIKWRQQESSFLASDGEFMLEKTEKGSYAINFRNGTATMSGECVPGNNILNCKPVSGPLSYLGINLDVEFKQSVDPTGLIRLTLDFKGKSWLPINDKDFGHLEITFSAIKKDFSVIGKVKDFWGNILFDSAIKVETISEEQKKSDHSHISKFDVFSIVPNYYDYRLNGKCIRDIKTPIIKDECKGEGLLTLEPKDAKGVRNVSKEKASVRIITTPRTETFTMRNSFVNENNEYHNRFFQAEVTRSPDKDVYDVTYEGPDGDETTVNVEKPKPSPSKAPEEAKVEDDLKVETIQL